MSAWTCACGRKVPPHLDRCRCGARASQPPSTFSTNGDRSPATSVGLAAVFLVLGYGAYRWFASQAPKESATVPVTLVRQEPPPPPAIAPHGTWETLPTPPPGAQQAPRDVTVSTGFAGHATATEPPSGTAPPAEPSPPPGLSAPESTEMDRLRDRADSFRREYHPVKEQVEKLEREVAELETESKRHFGGGNTIGSGSTAYRTAGDEVAARLSKAKNDLFHLRNRLLVIEERARQAGVPYGQLY